MSTILPKVPESVYNKSMKNSIAINLSSEQYEMLLEMFNFISDMNLYDEDDTEQQFDELWDAVLDTTDEVVE